MARSPAVVLAVAACVLAPTQVLADSVVDAAIKPYFVVGTALVFLGVDLLISPVIGKRRWLRRLCNGTA